MTPFAFDPESPRIRLAHRRLEAAYDRRPGAEAPVVEPGGYARPYSTQEMLADLDKMLDHAVRWANAMAASDNDWPPFVDTFCGVCLVAEAFGCEVVSTPEADPWTRPAITATSQVPNLRPAKIGESYMARRLFEWVDFAQRRLGAAVPFWTMDIQSPFSVAAHVLDPEELMIACGTNPGPVHDLCRMIADYTIELMQKHLTQMEHPGFPGRNFPSISQNIGICIADDTPLIMLSPAMYAEFAVPYNNRIADALGGIHIHSCGDYRHNLDGILTVRNIRSVQIHAGAGEFPQPETAAEECAFHRARGRVTMLMDANGISRGDAYRSRPKDFYADYMLPRLGQAPLAGVILQSCGPGQDLPDVHAGLRWTRERLTGGVG